MGCTNHNNNKDLLLLVYYRIDNYRQSNLMLAQVLMTSFLSVPANATHKQLAECEYNHYARDSQVHFRWLSAECKPSLCIIVECF